MSAPGVTSFRGPPPPAEYLGGGGGAGGRGGSGRQAPGPGVRPRATEPLLDPLVARIAATLALLAFGAVHWMMMLGPTASARAAYCIGIAVLAAALLVVAGRLHGIRRWALLAFVVVGGAALSLLAGGIADEQLRPENWGTISRAVSGGLSALPGARIPYRGLDEQLRLVIPLGGTVLSFAAVLLALWPRSRRRAPGRVGFATPALIALVMLYAVPAVSLILDAEFLRGAVLALLVVAFLRLDRLRRPEAPAAFAVLGAAAILALVVAPALDKPDPWFNYEDWAQSAAGAKSTTFSWDHDYGALRWPRDGRELLRIKSRQRSYWKADDLDVFDGRKWVRDQGAFGRNHSGVLFGGVDLRHYSRWSFMVQVTVRNLRTLTLPMAGDADLVEMPGREAQQIRPGIWTVGRAIRRGDAYRAEVYLPQPSAGELAAAGTGYSVELLPYTSVDIVPKSGPQAGRAIRTRSASFFKSEPILPELGDLPAASSINDSGLRRAYRLARRLLDQSATPYGYVKNVQRYLEEGFTYSEAPPAASRTLDGFLFDSHSGYCQHFSGAMALLLRLGGIPARVATGFAPGSYDRKAKEYVVRDLDAHSWVEAFFPGIGWVTFDPTPAAAPPRSQALATAPSAASGDIRDVGTTQVVPTPVTENGPDIPWSLILLGIAGGAGVAAGGRGLWRRRERPHRPAVFELERALRGAGHALPSDITLHALETRYRSTPPVARYAAALRAQRYADTGAGPTAAQRRSLRRALGRGRGPVTRLRTWMALPPRIRRRPPTA